MEIIETITDTDYQAFLKNHPEVNFLQSPDWGVTHEALGYKVRRGGIQRDDKLVATWLAIVKDARRGRYLEVPGGPVLDWSNEALASLVLQALRQIAQQERCVFVRLRPSHIEESSLLQLLHRHGVRRAPMHLHAEHTHVIDITQEEEALLAAMRRQTRYEVRRVVKRGVIITCVTPTEADIDRFYALQADTAKRHGFITSSRKFLQALRQALGGALWLYRAEKDGVVLNEALVISWGDEADYYEAASSIDARKEPGAYGIIWQAIQDMKRRQVKRFNLWGIAYTNNPHHRYAGVTTFKRGFGGEDVVFCPAHDIVIAPVRYVGNWLVETIRRKRRGL